MPRIRSVVQSSVESTTTGSGQVGAPVRAGIRPAIPSGAPAGDPDALPTVTTVEVLAESVEAAIAVLDHAVAQVLRAVPGSRQLAGPSRLACDLELPSGSMIGVVVGRPWPRRAFTPASFTLSAHTTNQGADIDVALAALRRVPLTGFELADLRRHMPLTGRIAAHLPPAVLATVAPVLVIHHMLDFLVMVDAVVELGVPAELITVFDKGYRYRYTERVDAHLKAAGIAVHPYNHLAEALPEHVTRGQAAGRQTLLVDDGGYTLPVLLDHHPQLVAQVAGLVEQTKSGIFRLERYAGRLPVPIFSVAESRLKATVESWGIADAATRNVLALLPDEKWEGQAAVVLGYGRIGEQVAHLLETRRMRVAVYDPDPVALIAAHERGFFTARSLCHLIAQHQPMLLVGTSGRTSLRGEHLDRLSRDAYVVSLTSRQREVALDEFAEAAVFQEDLGRLGLRYVLPGGRHLTVLADGWPINFHYAESLPNRYSDLVLAAMLIGAATLATPGHRFRPGHNAAASDAALGRSGLAERYYQLFGPPQP